jgi:beta-glucosidase
MPETFINPLRSAVKNGKVSMEVLNQRVREVLYVKFWLGMLYMFFSFDGNKVKEYGLE